MKQQAVKLPREQIKLAQAARRAESACDRTCVIIFVISVAALIVLGTIIVFGVFKYTERMDVLASADMPQSVHTACQTHPSSYSCQHAYGQWAAGVLAEKGLQ